jgi:hypothetical protein
MRDRQAEADPAGVPVRAKQAGEIQGRWSWVEPSVWTERMLTALEVGVKGGKWNAFFAEQGLFSFTTAYVQARQSSRR